MDSARDRIPGHDDLCRQPFVSRDVCPRARWGGISRFAEAFDPEGGRRRLQSEAERTFTRVRPRVGEKGGDYVFLEEASGNAYHIIVQATHEIQGYIQHYLHDEKVTLDVDGKVTVPTHFNKLPIIKERLGANAETAYGEVVAAFPTVWTANHRGDGLASLLMIAGAPSQKSYLKLYPNGMPELSSVIAGAKLFDPRTSTTAFSRNLGLMRFWHLTHPVGGKLTVDDMYLPEWNDAATVSDQLVLNRDGVAEPRYHGGFWFRANNDPVEVGRIMDQAAELVVYERPDGLVGVHAGQYVEPDITLTANDLVSVTLDANSRDASNVLAVRGRYTGWTLITTSQTRQSMATRTSMEIRRSARKP